MTLLINLLILLLASQACATVYLDGAATGCSNGATTYSAASRSCGGGSDTVYLDLTAFSAGIAPSATNYIREGSYFRDDVNGSLYVAATKAGSEGNYTVIKAYPSETAVIGTATRGATYNSNPSDATGAGSWNYYPNVAVAILGAYVELNGVKAYGETSTNGADHVRIVNNDLGGGGPATSGQGAVLKLENLADAYIANNAIHNSCLAVDSTNNGPGIIFYNANAIVTGNTFYDNYSADIYTKDSGGQAAGKTTEISYNFFKPSAIRSNAGVMGHNQDVQAAQFLVHHNVFLGKGNGYSVWSTPLTSKLYNNTFINCGYDIDNSNGGGAHPIQSYNNLFYHATSQYYASLYTTTYTDYLAASDWNVYFGSGSKWGKSAPDAVTWETTLAGWKTRSGMDAASVEANPNFVNAAGSTAASFKRTAYAESMTGSTYSLRAGAYETGSEAIGYVSDTPPDPNPPPATHSLGSFSICGSIQ